MEVVYYQPLLLTVVLKIGERVRKVVDQLKNYVSNILTPVKVGENGSSEQFDPWTNGIST